MLILGIESSCDETAVAVVRNGREVLASRVSSQTELHRPFGGVVPEVAARQHLNDIDPLVTLALQDAQTDLSAIDAIAVTQGPGLIGALLVGAAYAKGLAQALGVPLIPLDHVHAHVFGALLGVPQQPSEIFPAFALVVSGGHTNLYHMETPTSFNLLARSIDDACGECFDKVAKLLGLGYPGGPMIEKLARDGRTESVPVPHMMAGSSRLEFSYSGLKTHMANLIAAEPAPPAGQRLADLCAAFQHEALSQIARKLKAARSVHPETKSVLVAGGVAANQKFRQLLGEFRGIQSYFPGQQFCSDNAAMIAAFGWHLFQDAAGDSGHAHDRFMDLSWDAYSRYEFAPVAVR